MSTLPSMAALKQLEDITECPICAERYVDPRVLPCIHTYCLKCIDDVGKKRGKQPGQSMSCPLCRKDFNVPEAGFAGLPKNLFVQKLLQVRDASPGRKEEVQGGSLEPKKCAICADRANEVRACEVVESKTATMHCVDCRQDFCRQCGAGHTRVTVCAEHKLVELEVPVLPQQQQQQQLEQQEQQDIKVVSNVCEVHKTKNLDLYCANCKQPICVICYIGPHKDHSCSDIDEVYRERRSQLTEDIDRLSEVAGVCLRLIQTFDERMDAFVAMISKREAAICETAEALKQRIDNHKTKLIKELTAHKLKRLRQFEAAKRKAEKHLAEMESFQLHCVDVRDHGAICEVTVVAEGLRQKASELIELDVVEQFESPLKSVVVSFKPSELLTKNGNTNVVGGIVISEVAKPRELVDFDEDVLTTNSRTPVYGLTTVGNELFVIHGGSQHVDVYDASTLTPRRQLPVPGLGPHAYGLTASSVERAIFVSDFCRDLIHRVELGAVSDSAELEREEKAGLSWTVAHWPAGLSTTRSGHVLLVSYGEKLLQEFTTRGGLIRQIILQAELDEPQHAVRLPSDNYLITHSGKLHRLCVIDTNGDVLLGYGGQPGSGKDQGQEQQQQQQQPQLNVPACVALDRNGTILVTDVNNDRIVVVNKSLSAGRELPVAGVSGGGLHGPFALWWDEWRDRLYVGEFYGGRVLAVDDVTKRLAC